jgi:aspartyl-tRNA synthetase
MAFEKVGRKKQEVIDKFGAMYEAFQYGVPPHG